MLSESKFSKYLLYAIGEIVLVVIGILIALQINIWNEGRKEGLRERIILFNLVEDLKADSTSFQSNLVGLNKMNILHRQLYEVINNEADHNDLENVGTIRFLPWLVPITKENDPFIANKISNEAIRREIQGYFLMMNNVDYSYTEFSELIKSRMRPYLGEKGLYNLDSRFADPSSNVEMVNREEFIIMAKTDEFQQIFFECNLKLSELIGHFNTLAKNNEVLKKRIITKLQEP
jgi:hypothetical protein